LSSQKGFNLKKIITAAGRCW